MPLAFNIQSTFSRLLLAALVDSVPLANDLTSFSYKPLESTSALDIAFVYIPVKGKWNSGQ